MFKKTIKIKHQIAVSKKAQTQKNNKHKFNKTLFNKKNKNKYLMKLRI